MKKLSILLVLVLIATLLLGCQKSHSQIIEENNKHFLILDNLPNQSSTGYKAAKWVEYETFDELLTDIHKGSFTDEELSKISEFPKDKEDRIKLFDLNYILEPVYSESITDYDVNWYGSYYTFSMQTDDPDTNISLSFYTKEYLENAFKNLCKKAESPVYDVLSTSHEEERNASVICYRHAGTEYKQITYTIVNENATYRIVERYYISGYLPNEKIKLDQCETVPYQIGIYTSKNDHHFRVTVNLPTERPSIEWLTQFDVREYTPE